MPLEFGFWRIDGGLKEIDWGTLGLESQLEAILDTDITVAAPNWMTIGRQVKTDHGGLIDLLAIDRDGNLIVIELKRDKTPRDIVAQSLDYGSWVRELDDEAIVQIFADYLKTHHPERGELSINDAFCERFQVKEMPDELNEAHELVIVAASLDPGTERIVKYLAAEYGVRINALFFRVFKDGEREYMARAWLREAEEEAKPINVVQKPWNGEYYASFGGNPNRSWDEAVKYGFITAGGGHWYTATLSMLSPGDRVWVNVPGTGYVGVGVVEDAVCPIDDFKVTDASGNSVPLVSLDVKAAKLARHADDPETGECLVRMKWVNTVPVAKAIKEKGFFGNQNSVASPLSPKWDYTVQRLKKHFSIG